MEIRQIEAEYYCGVDMHARTSHICIMDQIGAIKFTCNILNNFEIFKQFVYPFLPDLAVGTKSTYNYYWLPDGCQEAGIQFYLGHALYMKAISGNNKTDDKLDSETGANLMRTNFFR